MTVGEIVENLIRIKDTKDLYMYERDTINEACNLLTHRFNNMMPAHEQTYEHIHSIIVMYEDIKDILETRGFISSENNVKILLENGNLKHYLEDAQTTIDEIVLNVIDSIKDSLEKKEN